MRINLLIKTLLFVLSGVVFAFSAFAAAAANNAPTGAESAQDEDAFGSFIYTCMPGILESKGEINKSDKGSVV